MGQSIDLYSYDYEKLKGKVLDFCKTEDSEMVEKVLLVCGNKIGDRYVILNQELWDGYSCYYNVAHTLEKIFNVEDVFWNIFCKTKDSETDKQDLISAMDMSQIVEVLELDVSDDWYSDSL